MKSIGRAFLILVFGAFCSLPSAAVKKLPPDQLESLIQNTRSDKDLARRLSGLELTARVPADELTSLMQHCPGAASRHALLSLADRGAFLPLPALPGVPAPLDEAAQRALLDRVYPTAEDAIARLPNFFAIRRLAAFADHPPIHLSDAAFLPYQPVSFLGESTATVLYRDGEERTHFDQPQEAGAAPPPGLVTSGEFGATLKLVLADTLKASPKFARWEKLGGKLAAVFRYTVARQNSHYELKYCCTPAGSRKIFVLFAAYHGEITVDPDSATVVRLTMLAEVHNADPFSRADLAVEYGPVEIGGRAYVCPLHSVSIVSAYQPSSAPGDEPLHFGDLATETQPDRVRGSLQMLVNDITFEQYHLFRGDTRMLPADGSGLAQP